MVLPLFMGSHSFLGTKTILTSLECTITLQMFSIKNCAIKLDKVLGLIFLKLREFTIRALALLFKYFHFDALLKVG